MGLRFPRRPRRQAVTARARWAARAAARRARSRAPARSPRRPGVRRPRGARSQAAGSYEKPGDPTETPRCKAERWDYRASERRFARVQAVEMVLDR